MNTEKINKLLVNLIYCAQDLEQLAMVGKLEDDDEDASKLMEVFDDILKVRDEITKTIVKLKKEV